MFYLFHFQYYPCSFYFNFQNFIASNLKKFPHPFSKQHELKIIWQLSFYIGLSYNSSLSPSGFGSLHSSATRFSSLLGLSLWCFDSLTSLRFSFIWGFWETIQCVDTIEALIVELIILHFGVKTILKDFRLFQPLCMSNICEIFPIGESIFFIFFCNHMIAMHFNLGSLFDYPWFLRRSQ